MLPKMCNVMDYVTNYKFLSCNGLQFVSDLPSTVHNMENIFLTIFHVFM